MTVLAKRMAEVERGFVVTPDGLELTRKPKNLEELKSIGRSLSTVVDCYQWAMGDWINLLGSLFPHATTRDEAGQFDSGRISDKYEIAMEVLGRSYDECVSLGATAEAFPPAARFPKGLKYSFFRLARSLDPVDRQRVLSAAYKETWTTRVLVAHVKELNADKPKPAFSQAGIAAIKEKAEQRRKAESPWVQCPCPCGNVFQVEGHIVPEPSVEAEAVTRQ
jgi:hypothetical protein